MNRDKQKEQKVEFLKRKFKSPFGHTTKLILIHPKKVQTIFQIQFRIVQSFCVKERVCDNIIHPANSVHDHRQGKITRAMTLIGLALGNTWEFFCIMEMKGLENKN